MRIISTNAEPTVCCPPHQLMDESREVGEGARYFGYGVMEAFANRNKGTKAAQLTRSCLLAPFSFTVELLFKPGVSEEQRNQVRRALQLLGLLGGLGSKSRKGYGSLTLTSLRIKQRRDEEETEGWKPPENPQELVERLSELLGSRQIRAGNADASVFDDLPEWTAFSPASRILVLPPDDRDRTPLALLNRVGREMVRYRSWGNKNQRTGKHEIFRGVQSEQNFKEDHDAIYKSLSLRRAPANAPKRAVFGLPHNYFFGSLRAKADLKPDSYDRRASPLLIHVHQTTERSTPIAVVTFLPSRFLPEDKSMISVGGSNVALSTSELWKPIEDWFKRLKDEMPKPHDRKEPFGAVLEVKHG